MSGTMGLYEYEGDDGVTAKIRIDNSNAAAVSAVVTTGRANKDVRTRLRYILCKHPTSGRQKKIVVTDPTNVMWLGSDDTITLVDTSVHPSADIVYAIQGRVGERRYA